MNKDSPLSVKIDLESSLFSVPGEFPFVIFAVSDTSDTLPSDPISYEHLEGKAIPYENIEYNYGKTISECEKICNGINNCLSFEYGVAYGGLSGTDIPETCKP